MLNGKIVVITGGAGLIGKSFVQAVIGHGGKAVIADINVDVSEVEKESNAHGLAPACIDTVELDITDKESVEKAIVRLDQKYGRIDALVNSAYPRNHNYGKHFFDVTYEDFTENISLNLGGYFLTSQQFAAYFKKQGYGNIVNIASVYGVVAPKFGIYQGTPMTMPVEYAAIKAGLIHMTRYMAKYFSGMDIRVNAISPGGVLDRQPEAFLEAYRRECLNKGMLEPDDLAGALLFLLSDMSRFVNGQNIVVDDGFVL